MTDNDLRVRLADLADDARSNDLYSRSIHRSRQIRQRRIAVGAASFAAVVALVVGVTANVLPRLNAAPLPPAATATPTITPATTPSPTPSASSSATQGPTMTTPLTLGPTLPASHYSGPVTVPPWPGSHGCPDGSLTFTDGRAASPNQGSDPTRLLYQVTGTLGGQPVTVMEFQCGEARGAIQLAAYRGTAGAYTLVGKVADIADGPSDVAVHADRIAITGNEVVLTAEVTRTFTDFNSVLYVYQVRRYALNGSSFVQTAGPTAIVADGTDAVLTVTGNIVLEPAQDGCRKGTITYTVRNSRPQAVADVAAVMFIPFPVASDCPAAPGVYENGFMTGSVTVPGNQSVTATATIYYSERRGMGKVDPQSVSFPSFVIGLTVGGAVYPTHTLYQAVYQ